MLGGRLRRRNIFCIKEHTAYEATCSFLLKLDLSEIQFDYAAAVIRKVEISAQREPPELVWQNPSPEMCNRGRRAHSHEALKEKLELSFGAGHKGPKVDILLRIEVLGRARAGET